MPYLILLLFFAFFLRLYGINWDQGFHLHPDERALIMVTERIRFFNQLNPDFFNYGSLPIYLLKGVSQLLDFFFSTQFATYQGMLYVGRYLSIIFDIGTVLLIYKITGLLFKNKMIQLYSSFFYSIAFFPIQNSHFFVVDVSLTFFTTLLIYNLLRYIALPSRYDRIKMIILLGAVFAAMFATKFTAIIFLPIILLVLIVKSYFSSMVEKNIRLIHSSRLARTIKTSFIFFLSSIFFFFIFMPYAFLESYRFLNDVLQQTKMNSDPYTFPYTLQYVGTLPYLYYMKNIFFWGLGPIISVLSLLGLLYFIFTSRLPRRNVGIARRIIKLLFERSREQYDKLTINNHQLTIFFLFYFFYFLIIGRSAVKFMRYMLPVYPFFAIMAGYGLYLLQKMSFLRMQESIKYYKWIPTFVGMTVAVIWTLMFVNIYFQKHTRVAATDWILQNIPKGSTLALEHWDDGLPLTGGENYKFVELTLYDQPDDELKWSKLNEKLFQAEYIIIASNRLYVPLQKLSDCKKYKSCYPKTAEYYKKLFSGKSVILGRSETTTPESLLDSGQAGMTEVRFKKVAEFSVYPKISINNYQLTINDDSADESFTVYDHPKIFIFKKT